MSIGILKWLAVVSQWSDFLYPELRMYDNWLEFHAVKVMSVSKPALAKIKLTIWLTY
jgi:hypothetical protein